MVNERKESERKTALDNVIDEDTIRYGGSTFKRERTCRDVSEPPKTSAFWPSPHFKCSDCGADYVLSDYAYWCPACGARVERDA